MESVMSSPSPPSMATSTPSVDAIATANNNMSNDTDKLIKSTVPNIDVVLDKYTRTDRVPLSENGKLGKDEPTLKSSNDSYNNQNSITSSKNKHAPKRRFNKLCINQDHHFCNQHNINNYRRHKPCTTPNVITERGDKHNSSNNYNNNKANLPKSSNVKHDLLTNTLCDVELLSHGLRVLHMVLYEHLSHLSTSNIAPKQLTVSAMEEPLYPALTSLLNFAIHNAKQARRVAKLAAAKAKEDERCAMLYEYATKHKEKMNKKTSAVKQKQFDAEMQECTFTPAITETARKISQNSNISSRINTTTTNTTNNYNNNIDHDINNSNKKSANLANAQQAFLEKCLQWQEAVQAKLKQRQREQEKEEAEQIAKERATRLRRIRAWTSHSEYIPPRLDSSHNTVTPVYNGNDRNCVHLATLSQHCSSSSSSSLSPSSLLETSEHLTSTYKEKAEVTTKTEDVATMETNSSNTNENLEQYYEQYEKQEQEHALLYHEDDYHVPITSRSERNAREYLHQLSRSASKKHNQRCEDVNVDTLPTEVCAADSGSITNTTMARKMIIPVQTHKTSKNNKDLQTPLRCHSAPRRTLREFLNDVANDKLRREIHVKELQEQQNKERHVVHLNEEMLSPLFVPNALPLFRTDGGQILSYDQLDVLEKERAKSLLRRHHLEYLINRHEMESAKQHKLLSSLELTKEKEQEANPINNNNNNSNNNDNDHAINEGKNHKRKSSKEISELVERLEAHQAAKEARLHALQWQIQQEQCSFQPKITHRSEVLARKKNGNVPIYKRATAEYEQYYQQEQTKRELLEKTLESKYKEREGKEEKKRRMNEEYYDDGGDGHKSSNNDNMFERSYPENENNHIINRNNEEEDRCNYRYGSEQEQQQVNNISAEEEPSNNVTRKVNDMLARSNAWNERRIQRIRLARAEQEAAKLAECTFRPQRLHIHNDVYVTPNSQPHALLPFTNSCNTRGSPNEIKHSAHKKLELEQPSWQQEHTSHRNSLMHDSDSHDSINIISDTINNYYNDNNNNHAKNRNSYNAFHDAASDYCRDTMDYIAHVSPEISYTSTDMRFASQPRAGSSNYLPNSSHSYHERSAEYEKLVHSPIKRVQRRQDALATAANIRVMQELEMLQNELAYHKERVLRESSKQRNHKSQRSLILHKNDYNANNDHPLRNEHQRHKTPLSLNKREQIPLPSSSSSPPSPILGRKNYAKITRTSEDEYKPDVDFSNLLEDDEINYTTYHHDNKYNTPVLEDDVGVMNDEEDMWDELDAETDAIISMLEQRHHRHVD